MTSFFYVVSIAFHTSVPAFRKCMDTSRKKVFWLRVQPLVHRLLHLFVGPERLASHRLFEWSKDVKITWGEVWRVWRMWKTLEEQILDCCNSWTGSHVATKHLYSEVHAVWAWRQDAGDSWGDLHTLYWSQCSPWACSAPKLPLVHPKIESAKPFPQMVVCGIFSVLVKRYGAMPCSRSWFPAGGSGPRFHLQ